MRAFLPLVCATVALAGPLLAQDGDDASSGAVASIRPEANPGDTYTDATDPEPEPHADEIDNTDETEDTDDSAADDTLLAKRKSGSSRSGSRKGSGGESSKGSSKGGSKITKWSNTSGKGSDLTSGHRRPTFSSASPAGVQGPMGAAAAVALVYALV